jgi:hypothetical protein
MAEKSIMGGERPGRKKEKPMTYHGHVKNGTVVLENGAVLPDGTEVRVEVVAHRPADAAGSSLYDRLRPFIGAIDDLPADMAENHDHYVHGTSKK